MILNSDAIVKKGTSQKLVNFLNKHEEVAVVGPKLLNMDGTPQANCGRFPNLFVSAVMLFLEHYGGRQMVRFSPAKSGYVDWLMGAAFMARKAGFDKIGGFDEALFMYMEEVDWFYRLREAGMKAYFLKEAEIVHLGLGSSTSGKKEPILNIYRGLIHFYKKHYNFISLIILRVMLKLKAAAALLLGYLTGNRYLKETYEEAFKLA